MTKQAIQFPDPLPVFVYGALRSGTTVFRLMLDAHEDIGNPGERDFLFDFLHPDPSHPTGWRYDLEWLYLDRIFQSSGLRGTTDASGATRDGLDLLADFLHQLRDQTDGKSVFTLNIHRHIGKVLEIFPQARIIHMLRDPRDVARSSIGMGWATHIYRGVDHWIETEQDWSHGTIGLAEKQTLTLTYESLFRDIETELQRVCAFVGVPFRPDMLLYHETSTYAPPDPKLVEQWRRKCDPDHVALLEGKAGALMQSRGYAPSGVGRVPSPVERFTLWIGHKTGVWRYGVQQYGVMIYFGEKLTRRLKIRGFHARLRNKMNELSIAGLK